MTQLGEEKLIQVQSSQIMSSQINFIFVSIMGLFLIFQLYHSTIVLVFNISNMYYGNVWSQYNVPTKENETIMSL